MTTARRIAGLVLASALAAGILQAPSQAEEPKKFEATILAPGGGAEAEAIEACPGGGDANGVTYVFFELEGDFKNFKVSGPAHLFNEPNPAGVHAINDYDIDLYVYDAKCTDITPDKAAPDAGTEIIETRRPARYALVSYWSGIHPELPITLLAANSKIK